MTNQQRRHQDLMQVDINELLKYYNEYFAWLPNYTIVNPFVVNEKANSNNEEKQIVFIGKISADLAKLPLEIDIEIPIGFPNEKISLTTTSLRNYAHLIPKKDNSSWFCLNTPFGETIEEQLDLEIERLSEWTEKYLNKGEKHELPPNTYRHNSITLCYDETPLKDGEKPRFAKTCWGITPAGQINSVLYPRNLGKKHLDLLKEYENIQQDYLFWLFSDTKPIKEDGSLPSDMKELNEILSIPKDLIEALEKFNDVQIFRPYSIDIDKNSDKAEKTNSLTADEIYISDPWKIQHNILLAIGFYYNDTIQWELLRIKYNPISVPVSEDKTENFIPVIRYGNKVYFQTEWMNTTNISYDNYFGRGRLSDEIVNSKIAIIGIGAIGSTLSEILARGGAKHLRLIDDDVVEHGNICRSSYYFTDVSAAKVVATKGNLMSISPYVDVEHIKASIYSEINYHSQSDINKFLNQADIIFDCTASNELLHCLSILNLEKPIISFAITNEARDLVCVTNSKDNLFEQRRYFLKQLEQETENLYYEGIGCYTPTFKANFADINSLLNLAIKHIDKSFNEQKTADSFVLSHTDRGILKDNIVTYHQKELGFTLSVVEQCLDEIKQYAYMHYPNEFGGYLLGGYSRDMKRIYLTNVIIPDQVKSGPAFFRPMNNAVVHKRIKQIYDDTDGLVNYIGEWHTHPEMANFYSSTDYSSIRKQAESEAVNTNNPLLCIVSIRKRSYEPKFYIYYDNELYEFEK